MASGLLLGINAMSTAAGGNALIWGDNGTAGPPLAVRPGGNGQYKIANDNSGLLLGVRT